MDELVERIISIIIQREKKTLFLSCQASTDINGKSQAFLYNKYIHLRDVDIQFLERFKNKDWNDSLVAWLYQSYNYDCCLSFELAFSDTNLIPNELFNCSVKLFNEQGKQYILFPKKIITFQQIALLTSEQILLLASNQVITDLAKERLLEKKITVKERSLPYYADGKSNWKCGFNSER